MGYHHPNDFWKRDYSVVIQEWSSDERTVSDPYPFGVADLIHKCEPFQLSDDDYIIGWTVFYTSTYVFGIDFYTKSGEEYSCKDEDRIHVVSGDLQSTTEYYDCGDDAVYYLSGLSGKSGLIIDGIQAQ